MNEDMRPLLQFRKSPHLAWIDVHSPTGTYGSYGSLENYKAFLEKKGWSCRVISAPIKRCPHCKQTLPD